MGNAPRWIASEAARAEQQRAASDARAQQAIEDSFKIAKEDPVFWKQLLGNLADNTNAFAENRTSMAARIIRHLVLASV
jgi:hypothetical protein